MGGEALGDPTVFLEDLTCPFTPKLKVSHLSLSRHLVPHALDPQGQRETETRAGGWPAQLCPQERVNGGAMLPELSLL